MKKLFLSILTLLALSIASEKMTLEEALVYAQKHGPKALIINREYEIARSQAFQGYGAVLPSFQARYSDVVRRSPVAEAVELPSSLSAFAAMIPETNEETKVKTTELSATWMVFSFAGFAAVGAANNAMDLADNQYADAKQALHLEITKTYYDLQSAELAKRLTEKIASQAAQHARNVELMYQNDLVNKKTYLDARIRMLEATQGAANGDLAYSLALRSFNSLLGLPLTENIALASQNIELTVLPDFDTAELTQYALANQPAYKAFETLVRLSEADEFGAWGESLPQFFLSYSKQNNKYDKETSYTLNGDTETKMWFASWNFFSGGGANFHKINEKKNTKEKMYAQRETMRAAISMAVEAAVTGVKVKATNYAMALEQDALADESLKIAEINFREGGGTSTDYNDALAQKLAAETTRIKAAANYAYAKEQLNYAVGKEIL